MRLFSHFHKEESVGEEKILNSTFEKVKTEKYGSLVVLKCVCLYL